MTPISARAEAAPGEEVSALVDVSVLRVIPPRLSAGGPGSGTLRAICARCSDLPDGCGETPDRRQPQAAEPSAFGTDLVAVVVPPAPDEESAEVDEVEDELAEELTDSLDAEAELAPEPACESRAECAPEWLPLWRRESFRESVR